MTAESRWVVGVVLGALVVGCGESILCRERGCAPAVTATFAEALDEGESYRLVVAAGDAEETCVVEIGAAGGSGGESGAAAASSRSACSAAILPPMKMAVFSSKSYDRTYLGEANAGRHAVTFLDAHLDADAAALAQGFEAVCVFVNDSVSRPVLERLHAGGTRVVLLRSAGFNHVDLRAAAELGITIARVPAYSPHAVAEHTLALLLSLNRKTHRAYGRVRDGNFSLDGLLGFDLYGKTVGLVGLGKIGLGFARIARGLGMRVLGFDPSFPEEARAFVEERSFDELLAESHIVSLHCPLNPKTHHLIDERALGLLRRGAILLNTSRGGLVDTRAVVRALKSGQLGGLGIDVYEEEGDLFFENLSDKVIQDDVFMRLLTFPNVLITGHQGFFTIEALRNIAQTTIDNLTAFEAGAPTNTVTVDFVGR